MSQEQWNIVIRKVNYSDVSVQLVMQCAPLLAGMKISNLFKVRREKLVEAIRLVRQLELSYRILLERNGKVTILLYDKDRMDAFLRRKSVRGMFRWMGYADYHFEFMISRFIQRYKDFAAGKGEFPHEMGLFLGYPPEDVVGFIFHRGKNFLISGYWKVYYKAEEKKKLFDCYDNARAEMLLQLSRGKELLSFIKIPACRQADEYAAVMN